ncbi:tRNA guanosine(34) transglycosylase Tgt [Crocinitomix catalasitica]|nr:tRNA guanosine(34) transglycosylase Tgt [Crocinitomix catalasitica]
MDFIVEAEDTNSKARAAQIRTDHGDLKTPLFMPVGTAGTVKAVHQRELTDDIKAQIILGNTYHLYLRPGLEVIEMAGGLHKFINWKKPMLTDSGGYQVYSLSGSRKIEENGVEFQSHIDGSTHFFSPEKAIDLQRTIGADIIMAFDECTPFPCEYNYAKDSMEMTHRWLQRCVEQMEKTENKYDYSQALFPIVQGSVYKDLRTKSAEAIAGFDQAGNAIGGLSVGEPDEDLYGMTELVCDILPKDKPRYLMGVGTPENLLQCIALGVDMFDCVMPTRNARHGMLFTSKGILNMRNARWKNDLSVLDEDGTSFVDQFYSKAYVRHLYHAKETLAMQIGSIHNLAFYLWLMAEARNQIENGSFNRWKNDMIPKVSRKL